MPRDFNSVSLSVWKSHQLGLSIPSSIEEEGNLLPLAPDRAYLGPDISILDELSVYLGWLKDLEFGKDMRKEASHTFYGA